MKVSLNIIKQFINFELPPIDELVQKINQQLGTIEEVINLSEKYKDAVIVKVVECEKHPNADKLSICKIDNGTSEKATVVCGAPNVHKDMWAIWLPPESVVPETYGTKEPFVLGARELRGVISHGMLASAKELGLGDDHSGIVEITEADILPSSGTELKPGASFAEVFGLDDTVIEIENKMFTHRPDLFGQLGVAREIAGITGNKFDDPKWYYELQQPAKSNNSFELKTFNDAGKNVARLQLIGMDNVTVKQSPLWLKTKLVVLGSKPINNVVDISNYVMLVSAQPTHCYDYDKLAGGTVGARMAQDGEKIELLNHKTYELTSEDIVIADAERPIGLGGIMGGSDSEVSMDTTRLVLEVANFDMYVVRKSSMRHGVFTDALTRFNKGQSMLMNPYVAQYTVELLTRLCGAQVATEVHDDLLQSESEWRTTPTIAPMRTSADITAAFINDRLGLKLRADEMVRLLVNVGFECEVKGDSFSYWAPAWRMDIQDKEDVVEEVGRLYGFDKLPRELPVRSMNPVPKNAAREVKQAVRESLSRAGASEVLTYSFVHEKQMKKAEQDISQAFQLSNALSPDLQYYRLSVLPSLLDKVHMNIKSGHDEFVLFEIGKGHNKKYHASDDNGLPSEMEFIDAVYASKHEKTGAAFFHIRKLVDQLARELCLSLVYKPVTEMGDYPVTAPFDLSRSALVETTGGIFIGLVGELKQSVLTGFKLPSYTAAMTLDVQGVTQATRDRTSSYKPLSRFPAVTQDLSLRVPVLTAYSELVSSANEVLDSSELNAELTPVSIYQSDMNSETKTITLRVKVTSFERTLKETEVSEVIHRIADKANALVGAQLA